jgi:hypothetical protein
MFAVKAIIPQRHGEACSNQNQPLPRCALGPLPSRMMALLRHHASLQAARTVFFEGGV